MAKGSTDWCISWQYKWGLPIPVSYHNDSGILTDVGSTDALCNPLVRVHHLPAKIRCYYPQILLLQRVRYACRNLPEQLHFCKPCNTPGKILIRQLAFLCRQRCLLPCRQYCLENCKSQNGANRSQAWLASHLLRSNFKV